MTDPKAEEPKGIAIQDKVEYVTKAFAQRKEALLEAYKNATNPLDRLSFRDKIEEMDLAIEHLKAILK